MINPTIISNTFTSAFITQYETAFNELIRLCQVASDKALDGKESKKEDQRAKEILLILEALDAEGLTDKETEAMEYCLRILNDSLVTPTIDPIVTVSAETPDPVVYNLHTYWPGLFSLTGQDVALTHIVPFELTAESGSFILVGSGVNFTHHISALSMTAAGGSFALTGQVIDLDLIHNNQYPIELNLSEAIPGAQVWDADFTWAGGSASLVAVGNGGTDSDTILTEETDIDVDVTKATNGGVTQDAWQIIFKKNGLQVDFRTGLSGETVNEAYSYTGLSHLDQLAVDVTEG